MAIRCLFNHFENLLWAVNLLARSCFWNIVPTLKLKLTLCTLHKGLQAVADFWKQSDQSSNCARKTRCQLLHAQALQTCKFKCQSTAFNWRKKNNGDFKDFNLRKNLYWKVNNFCVNSTKALYFINFICLIITYYET